MITMVDKVITVTRSESNHSVQWCMVQAIQLWVDQYYCVANELKDSNLVIIIDYNLFFSNRGLQLINPTFCSWFCTY